MSYHNKTTNVQEAVYCFHRPFESINRNILWKKLANLNMEPKTLLLVKIPCSNTHLKVHIPSFLSHMPKIHDNLINIFLYAADMVLIDYSQKGPRRLLQKLITYCALNLLNINKIKSKESMKYNWQVNEEPIEQLNSFTYLGVVVAMQGH
ncbi:hypothetical protein E2320_002679, partial [Naja naja]